MTKKEVEELVKRYPYIVRAVQEGQTRAVFYVGKRKHEILITEVVKTVCRISTTYIPARKING